MQLVSMPRSTAVQAVLLGVLCLAVTAASLTPQSVLSPAMVLKDPSLASQLQSSSSSSAVPHWVPAQHQPLLQQQKQPEVQEQQLTPLPVDRPYVIAHRGASGLLPEHTLAAYKTAVAQGADFIECDVVVTKDLQLVCRHEPNLNSTTNALDLFPDRVATYNIDGESVTGVFTCDLALAEIKQLRAKQRWEFRDHSRDGLYQIATLDEFLDLVDAANTAAGRVIGIYPEVKHPTWHNQLPQMLAAGATIEGLIVQKLHAKGYAASGPINSEGWRLKPVLVQSFEPTSLQNLAQLTEMPLVLLLGGWPGYVSTDQGLTLGEMTDDAYLEDLAKYVSGVGPWKSSLYSVVDFNSESSEDDRSDLHVSSNSSSSSEACRSGRCSGFVHPDVGHSGSSSSININSQLQSTGLVAKLHKHGFQVHPYTLRDEQQFVPSSCGGDVHCEFAWFFESEKVDGAFADYPGTLATWLQQKPQHTEDVQQQD